PAVILDRARLDGRGDLGDPAVGILVEGDRRGRYALGLLLQVGLTRLHRLERRGPGCRLSTRTLLRTAVLPVREAVFVGDAGLAAVLPFPAVDVAVGGGHDFFGLPPLRPFARAARRLAGVDTLPPRLPNATAAGFFLLMGCPSMSQL